MKLHSVHNNTKLSKNASSKCDKLKLAELFSTKGLVFLTYSGNLLVSLCGEDIRSHNIKMTKYYLYNVNLSDYIIVGYYM